MKSAVDCIPCYLKQAISTMRVAGVSDSDQQSLLKALFPLISTLESSRTPAENSSLVLFELYRLLGMEDPFKEAKSHTNKLAKTFLPALERVIDNSEDPLLTALKASVAGNVIDMGIMPGFDIEASIREELSRSFERSDYRYFCELLEKGKHIVVIGDNSGEIFFDLLLLKQLRNFTEDLTYIVKGGPILNDATLEDAEEAGINLIAKVVTTGNNYLGFIPEYCDETLMALFRGADLVLAKGQANYETLEGTSFAGDKTFFLLRAKCPVVAENLGVRTGSSVLVCNRK